MGGAMMRGWIDHGIDASAVFVIEPAGVRLPAIPPEHCLIHVRELPVGLTPSVILLAVKPQMMGTVLQDLRGFQGTGAIILSVAAGCKIDLFEQTFGAETAILRAMPNTPAAIGQGMTVLTANPASGGNDRKLGEVLLSATGEVAWVEDEGLMDAVTGVSGSGPAYIFHLAECLAAAGAAAGLPADLADKLARQTVVGAAALMAETGDDPAQLRRNVTSPGGTTAAALDVLMGEGGLSPLMKDAVRAATQRSRELSE